MGKKGSWLSTFIQAFRPGSKEKLSNGSEKKGVKEKKKWRLGKLRHGEAHSFIPPLHREPSSIEKILGDADRENQRAQTIHTREHQKPDFFPPKELQQAIPLPPPTIPRHEKAIHHLAATPNHHHIAAAKIQTAYRGYMARRSFRALKGLVRLQGVVRGQCVKRQTSNAMKCMQLHVRIQQQIHSRRIQMMENQVLQRQNLHKIKESDNNLDNVNIAQLSEAEQLEWDDSILTKEEIEARLQRKVEAVVKRERALAYAYSHQLWKGPPKSTQAALMEIKSGGFPWWWNWLERQLPAYIPENFMAHNSKNNLTQPLKQNADTTPTSKLRNIENKVDTSTPTPLKSSAMKERHLDSPSTLKQANAKITDDEPSMAATPRDNESLNSCPPFSVPNYMTPTVSAKAKVRGHSILKDRSGGGTPRDDSGKRLSFLPSQGTGSLRWNKGSLFTGRDSNSQRILDSSFGNLSVDSTISLPAVVGRRPYK